MNEVPPPFMPPQQPRQASNNTLKIVLIVLAVIAIPCIGGIALIFVVGKKVMGNISPMVACAAGFEGVRTALDDYAKDHDGKLPNAATWQDDVRPYYLREFKTIKDKMGPFSGMDPNQPWGCDAGEGKRTGMAFNLELSGKKIADIQNKEGTFILFEIEKARSNAAEKYQSLPEDTSPMIFGEHRGWLKVPVEGEVHMNPKRRNRFNVSVDSKSDPDEKSSDKANNDEGK